MAIDDRTVNCPWCEGHPGLDDRGGYCAACGGTGEVSEGERDRLLDEEAQERSADMQEEPWS
jgi:DnaJ-class molecular chaperone